MRIELWYAKDYNRFCDIDGNIMHDLHELLEPWQINFVINKSETDSYCLLKGRNGVPVEVFMPDIFDMDEASLRYIHGVDGIYDCNINVKY